MQEVILQFENLPSSAVLTSIIWQLWGVDGGEALQLVEMDLVDFLKSHNMQGGDRKDDNQSCEELHAATPPQRLSVGDRNKERESMEAPSDGTMTDL